MKGKDAITSCMTNNDWFFQGVQCHAPQFGEWQNTHPAAGKAWFKLVRLFMRAEDTSNLEVLHGEVTMMVLMAKGDGCRDHHQSLMDGGQPSLCCGAVGAGRAVCPLRAPISCRLVMLVSRLVG